MAVHDRRWYGARAERIAAWRLFWRGYRLVARNWRCPVGEVDIIARHRGTLVFIEVKARRSTDIVRPEDQVGAAKQRKLSRLLDAWRQRTGEWDVCCRFDIAAVVLDDGGRVREFEVIVDAFTYVEA
jgi:putative endonuclease